MEILFNMCFPTKCLLKDVSSYIVRSTSGNTGKAILSVTITIDFEYQFLRCHLG